MNPFPVITCIAQRRMTMTTNGDGERMGNRNFFTFRKNVRTLGFYMVGKNHHTLFGGGSVGGGGVNDKFGKSQRIGRGRSFYLK